MAEPAAPSKKMIKELENTLIREKHFNNEMNCTCAYYPILIYLFAKISQAQHILEIGSAEGYGSFYLATAAKENGGMYYGIDIEPGLINRVRGKLDESMLPNQMICVDTKKLEELPIERVDIAFIDGEHTTEAVMHEVELIYPKLTKRGYGFLMFHDVHDMGVAGAWLQMTRDPRFECLTILHNYGLGIARAIDGMEPYESLAKRFEVKHL